MKEHRRILLVEENFSEVLRLEQAFHLSGITNPIQIARHREEASCYLRGIGIYANRQIYPLPSLIILGLTMRGCVGFRFLEWMSTQPYCRNIPIVAFSNIKDPEEVQEAYDLGVSAYLEKEKDLSKLVRLIQELEMLEDIWDRTAAPGPLQRILANPRRN